jgi:hypothetical protein
MDALGPLHEGLSELASRELNESLRAVMRSPEGRRVAYWLLYVKCGLNEATYDHKVKDGDAAAQHQAYKDGRRHVAIELFQLLHELDREAFRLMVNEQYDALDADEARAMNQSAEDVP